MTREEPMAVLFGYNPATGETTGDPLVGVHESTGMDPISWAWALHESIKGDFPGWLFAVTGNDAAKKLRGDALVKAVLG
jgi:hypothetical protein